MSKFQKILSTNLFSALCRNVWHSASRVEARVRRPSDGAVAFRAQVCRRRPSDPIQFLAQWLLRFRHFSQEALDLELAELQRAEERQRLAQYEYTALMRRAAAETEAEAEDAA